MATTASILIVDDDLGLLRLVEKALKREGFATSTAGSGQEAIAWLAVNRADLMLLDLKLPDIEGKELIIHLADVGRSVPFIIITGQGDQRVAVDMMKRGALDYLVKDVQFIEFVPTVVGRALTQVEKDKRLAFAEKQAQQLEARFRATVESAPAAMLMVDQEGSIVLLNAETERLFGYRREELLGQKVELLIPERLRSTHSGLRTQYFASPGVRRMGDRRDLFGLRKDGSEFPIEIGLNPVRTDQGMSVISAIVDISERKRQAEALRNANEALERSNIELQRFAYIASHDLQTPMRSIASFVELLRTTYADRLDSQANDWFRRTTQSIRDLQTLVRDLLEYSRVDSQAHPFETVSLRDVFDHAVALLDSSVRESGAEVTCGELPTVMGARSHLVQLMLNLIGNGLKYRRKQPPRVQVSAQRTGDQWTIAVRDNGIGIAPKHQARIFEIFQRLHDQQEYPGTGIGLAVCRRVVHRHGGSIWVESGPDHGSVFYFTLPEGVSIS